MNELDIQTILAELLLEEGPEGLTDVRTFEEDGVLTYNKGLVITTEDGSEFQITIVQSR